MIDTINCNLEGLVLHKVGNKYENENIHFSHSPLIIEDPTVRIPLLKFFYVSV